jgi:hypothetical protein
MDNSILFVFGILATVMLLAGFGYTISEFKKMEDHPENYRPEYDEDDVPPESK